jgi:hypothetical protein
MVLRMATPWQHPESGIFYFRQRVPKSVQHVVGRSIEKISLRTRDHNEAKIAFARVSLQMQERWRQLAVGPITLSEKQAAAIAGEIYRAMVEDHEDNPSQVPGFALKLLLDRKNVRPRSVRVIAMGDVAKTNALFEEFERRHRSDNESRIDSWLDERGLVLDAQSRTMLTKAVDRAILQAREQLYRMSQGDYSLDGSASRYPPLELEHPAAEKRASASGGVTFDQIIDAKAARRRAGQNSRPMPESSIRKYKRIADEFTAFRQSPDASTITVEEVEAWGDEMLEQAILNNRTIVDKLINIGTIVNWGKSMKIFRKSMVSAEPIAGQVELPDYSEKSSDDTGYTMDEARHVIQKARRESDPRTRWLPWLCLYSGLRISEANALRKSDFLQCEGRWFFKITTRGGRKLKTARSERRIPVHNALVEEGFLRWVLAAQEDQLFASGATSFVGRWVRGPLVGITRPDIAPNHGLRHLFIALCRCSLPYAAAIRFRTNRENTCPVTRPPKFMQSMALVT